MIIVVEGAAAGGRRAYCERFDPEHVVAAVGVAVGAPSGASEEEAAAFWGELHRKRWARACAAEARTGVAVCDTDPLRLHQAWIWGTAREFALARDLAREAIVERRTGIADVIACEAGEGDPLRAWYAALNELEPGRVTWTWPDRVPVVGDREHYDLELFDDWMANLPPK